jgi:hypothetical protein
MKIEVSTGEILDKLSILEIKLEHILDPVKRNNVLQEYVILVAAAEEIYDATPETDELRVLYLDLLNINKTLWNIEDQIRECERAESFGSDFIELARSVYYTNDDRAEVKKQINALTGSKLVEEKSYQDYQN